MDKIVFSRPLFISSQLRLESLVFFNGLVKSGDNNYTFNYYPMIMIKKVNKETFSKDSMYKVTERGMYKVIKFFNNILKWFYDEKRNDLFYYDEDNHLNLNYDYKNLKENVKDGWKSSISRMSAVPSVIRYESQDYEGILLSINSSNNMIQLIISDIQSILYALSHYSFQVELGLAYQVYLHSDNSVPPDFIKPFDGNTSRQIQQHITIPSVKKSYEENPFLKNEIRKEDK